MYTVPGKIFLFFYLVTADEFIERFLNMYDVMSPHAADFIDDAEINATLQYAAENAGNKALIEDILAKAEECKPVSHFPVVSGTHVTLG